MKMRRNTKKNGKPYGQFFITLGGGRREKLETQDPKLAAERFALYQKTGSWRDANAKPLDPLAAFDPPPPPIALLPPIAPPATPPAPSSAPPQAAPAGDDWAADIGARSSGAAKDDDDDDLDPEASRELLETAGAVLVEAQLMAQAWLLQRYKGINAAPVDPEHKLRQMGRKAWAKQFKIWWPDFNIPPWAVALGATGMAVMVQVGEGATLVDQPERPRPRPPAESSPVSTPAAPAAEAAAA